MPVLIILTATAALILLAAAAQALLAIEDAEEAWGDVPQVPRGYFVASHPASIAGEGERDHG